MERELVIGMHLVFIDEHRRERPALLTAIHGDPQGRQAVAEKMNEDGTPALDEHGHRTWEMGPPADHWPCINLLFVSDSADAQDQYGRQIDRPSSVCHHSDNTAIGYTWRFMDEEIDWGKVQPTIS